MENLGICNGKNENVEVVFTTGNGTKIYALKELLNIGTFRGLAAEKARRHSEFNISKSELTGLIKSIKDAVNIRQDFVEAMQIVQEMEYRNNFICEENSLLDLAFLYFFVEGENIDIPSEDYNERKRKISEAELDARAFFLRSALALTRRFSEQQGNDLISYLDEIKMISKNLFRHIPTKL